MTSVRTVLDASALIAFLLGERGGEAVVSAIEDGTCMSTVNVAEVAARDALAGESAPAIERFLDMLPFALIDFDVDLARRSAILAPLTRSAGLSLGDRACLALAQRLEVPALTADRTWLSVAQSIGVRIRLIR